MLMMKPTDVYRLTGASDPQIGPDGRVLYVVWKADEKSNEYLRSIWIFDGRTHRRLTDPKKKSLSPRWSPDGTRVAYVSNRDTEKLQLFVIAMDGGEAIRLTDLKGDVDEPTWSPDGKLLAFSCRDPDPAYDETDERKREPRRITRLWYKLDDEGWLHDRVKHIYVVTADGSEPPRAVTKGEWQDGNPAWSPRGDRIAFVSMRHDDWDVVPAQDVYVVTPDDGEPTRVTSTDGWCEHPSWSPDGSRIAYLYVPGIHDEPRHGRIAVTEVATGSRQTLTEGLDRNVFPYPALRAPVWDGNTIYLGVEDHGNNLLRKVAADGSSDVEPVVHGELVLTGYDARDEKIAYTATTVDSMSELFVDGEKVTDIGSDTVAAIEPVRPERFVATAPDGYEVEAWIMRPANFQAGTRYPVLLNVHGGPFTQYGNGFFDEFNVYTGAGYVVVYSNPRGSSGYSEEHGRAIRGPIADGPGMGSVDYDDVMAVMDAALERFDFCDPDRLGVMGGSYGGFMTSWIVSHNDRFKAACSERAVNNMHSFHGSSDLGWVFRGYIGAPVWEAPQAWLDISPITYAANITTPLLIIHSEEDHRCPIEQAEQLFTTLRLLQRDVEFVRFGSEGHELSRSGSPRHRVKRFEIILDWFDRKLKNP